MAQVYFKRNGATSNEAKLTLRSSQRLYMDAGGSQAITFEIPAEQLRQWDELSNKYVGRTGDTSC